MTRLCSSVVWIVFVRAQISPHLIFLTLGELGIRQDSKLMPVEMAAIRRREAEAAAAFLRASLTILSFPDLHLPFVPIENLVRAVLPIIREVQSDALFAFHPHETTRNFDHPDHNVTGLVAKHVGAAADVKHFVPSSRAMRQRPELYLWTSVKNEQTLVMKKDAAVRERRNDYLIKHYPSQFQVDQKNEWVQIFDSLDEAYLRVR
jgi:LmbE family N-acetylglucosaminyl deacetylase